MAAKEGASLDSLDKRISELERLVITSEKDVLALGDSSCLDTLHHVQRSLNKIGSKYSRVADVWKKIKELELFLSPEYLESASLTDDAKADIVIAGESQLRSCAEQLKQVDDLKRVVSTEPLKDLPTWSAKLQPLTELHIQEKEVFDASSKRLYELLMTYNNIISLVSKQFIQWDTILTQMEQAVEVKPED